MSYLNLQVGNPAGEGLPDIDLIERQNGQHADRLHRGVPETKIFVLCQGQLTPDDSSG